jgi:transposase
MDADHRALSRRWQADGVLFVTELLSRYASHLPAGVHAQLARRHDAVAIRIG